MTTKDLSDGIAELAVERVVALLAERVADRVVKALMDGGWDKTLAKAMIESFEKELETKGEK